MTGALWHVLGVPILAASVGYLAGCGTGECGGAAGTSDVCPPPVYGYAQVTGRVLRSDGSPVVGKSATVACGDVVGANDDLTDATGHFEMRLYYAVADTMLYPFPAGAADGGFDLTCSGFLSLNSLELILKDQIVVHFASAGAAVVPTETEWREGSP